MLKIITCKKPNQSVNERIEQLVTRYGLCKIERQSRDDALVVTRKGLALRVSGKLMYWHPGLLHTLREARTRHPWVKLGELTKGDRVLDCTLGLGTDARFISEITQTTVVGIEQSLEIYLISEEGLQSAGANIDVRLGHSLDFLKQQKNHSFDVIIADPMFPKHLLKQSQNLSIVRNFASFQTLNLTWLDEARRVARRCVLVKDHIHNDLLESLQAEYIWAKGKRSARYGRWQAFERK